MIVYDSGGRPVKLGESIGRGGEATVYRLKDQPGWLAKIYEPAPRSNYPDKLAWMLAHPPQDPTQAAGHPSLAWPAGLLFDARRRLAGFRLPHIRDAVPILVVFNPRRRAETLPQFDRRYLHRTARNLASALEALHRSGYVVGDLNESNVLVTASALVTLIDTDSFQVQEQRNGRTITHRCPVAKLEYTPPELQGKPMSEVYRLPEHDAFSLGVLIFQLLMQGSHPFRSQWLGKGEPPPIEVRIAQGGFPYTASPPCPVSPPKNAPGLELLHPALSELVRRCFVDGHRRPDRRPSPEQWERAIAEAESCLTLCPSAHFYSNHLRACPYCPPRLRTVRRRSGPVRPVRRDVPPRPAARPQPAAPTAGKPAPAAPARPASGASSAPAAAAAPAPAVSFPFLQQPSGLWRWMKPRVYKSFAVGGGIGALAGALPGAVAGAALGPGENALAWGLVWALGGAAAGIARGWLPWYRISLWVSQRIGWSRFWQAIGLLLGGAIGALAGLVIGWWAIFPVFFGILWGAKYGRSLGRRIWLAGNRFGWERIWAAAGAGGAALIGWTVAGWVSASGLADGFASSLAAWISSHSASLTLVWTVLGATGGALGGAISGTCADLFGRLSGLVD